MTDLWTHQLSEYLDGELAADARDALEHHLEGCAECREVLAGLRRLVARARALEDRTPDRDLWPGIAERIGASSAPPARRLSRLSRRYAFSLPQLAAAGIALVTVSGGSVWLLRPAAMGPLAVQPAPAATATPALPAATAGTRAAGSYDAAVADLERILQDGRGRLDSTTVRVLEQNLAVIDAAIAQARRAVAADSANLYLNSHLAETMRRKLELLRQAASLVATAS
jgi:anti-sigma factor RsiW